MNQLGRLSYEDNVELLVAVDSDTAPDSPLWSTLLAAKGDGAALRLYATSPSGSAGPWPSATPTSSSSSPSNAPNSTDPGDCAAQSAGRPNPR